MARTIWKFRLTVDDTTHVNMPVGAEVISWSADKSSADVLWLWAIVDPERGAESREFHVRGTGHPLGDLTKGDHLATVEASMGLVWHVFEKVPS